MPTQREETNLTTALFCRSSEDGTIGPHWSRREGDDLGDAFAVGRTVADRYALLDTLGEGAMGRVFLAKDLRLDRCVAMKVVFHRRPGRGVLRTGPEREARLGASLNHRGLAAVYDYGVHGDRSYTVFEYVEGETLREVLRRRGVLPHAEAAQVVVELADALDAAHAHGLVHRDLKPENVCRTPRGEFKVLDLGLAYVVSLDEVDGSYVGTPAYSSPEQAARRPTDGRSDQYALGLVAFEMLTGEWAFRDKTIDGILRRRLEEAPPSPRDKRPELPLEVERAVLRALSKDPADRFPTCREFAAALAGVDAERALPHMVSVPGDRRLGFYLGHVGDESLVARRLAAEVEREGYACWVYGRDAVPGVPLFEQSKGAMARSQGVVLLVSRPAIQSREFEREVLHASALGCPLLPVLVDVSREEFERHGASALSPAGAGRRGRALPHRRGRRSCRAGAAFGAPPGSHSLPAARSRTKPARRGDHPARVGNRRPSDRHRGPRPRAVPQRRRRRFPQQPHAAFRLRDEGFWQDAAVGVQAPVVVANGRGEGGDDRHGAGRASVSRLHERHDVAVTEAPEPVGGRRRNKTAVGAVLRVSVASHFPDVFSPRDAGELSLFPSRLRGWLEGTCVQPTVAFKELTNLGVGELNHLLDASENFLDQKARQVHGGICLFIDKVDQAIHQLPREAWVAVQAGLVEAAWEIMSSNSHVKVYASIRQEAFSNYQSPVKSNLFSATTTLDYSEAELRGLLDQLAQCYEGCGTFAEFLGTNVVQHAAGRRRRTVSSTCGGTLTGGRATWWPWRRSSRRNAQRSARVGYARWCVTQAPWWS